MATELTAPETAVAGRPAGSRPGREGRGKLKIFLGAAPGVGKTYEMLTQGAPPPAGRRGCGDRRGRNPWPAWKPTPSPRASRPFPRSARSTKAVCVAEMDLDAILQRRPALGAGGRAGARQCAKAAAIPNAISMSRKSWRRASTSITTVNIQHIESLNDVVAQITRIHVRETVPDAMLDQADEIELVDLTAEDLLQRLKDGKVYVKAQAERALQPFLLARQSDGPARTGAAPRRPAGGPRHGRLYAGPCHRRSLAGQRACAGLHQ